MLLGSDLSSVQCKRHLGRVAKHCVVLVWRRSFEISCCSSSFLIDWELDFFFIYTAMVVWLFYLFYLIVIGLQVCFASKLVTDLGAKTSQSLIKSEGWEKDTRYLGAKNFLLSFPFSSRS